MKQKHGDTSLEGSDDFAVDVVATERSVVGQYLDRNVFDGSLCEKEKALYDYNRKMLSDSLDERTAKNPVMAALIERIARSGILIERFERLVIQTDGLDRQQLERTTMRGSSYITLLSEHRKCIETFVNIRWAYDQKKPKRTLETLRQTISQETEDA